VHPLFPKASSLTQAIIGAAIEVHRDKGPGLVDSINEWCLSRELELCRVSTIHQKVVKITCKGFIKEEPPRFDLLVEDCVIVELNAVETVLPVHKAQMLRYMKLLNVPLGLLINFNVAKLTDGLSRVILQEADK
jgi:GxxExxY protein